VFERLHVYNTTPISAKLPTQWRQPPQE
jgi:hypothetical protein